MMHTCCVQSPTAVINSVSPCLCSIFILLCLAVKIITIFVCEVLFGHVELASCQVQYKLTQARLVLLASR